MQKGERRRCLPWRMRENTPVLLAALWQDALDSRCWPPFVYSAHNLGTRPECNQSVGDHACSIFCWPTCRLSRKALLCQGIQKPDSRAQACAYTIACTHMEQKTSGKGHCRVSNIQVWPVALAPVVPWGDCCPLSGAHDLYCPLGCQGAVNWQVLQGEEQGEYSF
jgi:hypothetical protein